MKINRVRKVGFPTQAIQVITLDNPQAIGITNRDLSGNKSRRKLTPIVQRNPLMAPVKIVLRGRSSTRLEYRNGKRPTEKPDATET